MAQTNDNFWEQYADDFTERNNYVIGEESMNILLARCAKLTNLGNTLELACGNGVYTRVLAKNASRILATDYSQQMVDVTKRALSSFDNIDFKQADAFHLDMDDNTYDTVFMANLLHIVPDCNALLQEVKRVLKPNGKVIALDVTGDGMSFFATMGLIIRFMKTYGKPDSNQKAEKKNLNVAYVEQLFEKSGFKKESIERIGGKTKAILSIGIK